MTSSIQPLLALLRAEPTVYIQPHDFPDPDGVAAAFGLQYVLASQGISAELIYAGELQTNTLDRMIAELGIVLRDAEQVPWPDQAKVVIVDGCKGNDNVAQQRGEVLGVIDHHLGTRPEQVAFVDIRPEYGACSTIVALYAQELELILPEPVATALAIGIHVDTNSLRRRASPEDLRAFAFLYPVMDYPRTGAILRNNLSLVDLPLYTYALQHIRLHERFAFCYLPQECSQNLLGILADFFLSIEEVNFVVLCARSGERLIFSARSERPEWNAAVLVKAALRGLGSGGGHRDMAGAVFYDPATFDVEQVYHRFLDLLVGLSDS